ncbi:MAG: 30S ribosomal protein S12 methylthiotransferase RimO [Desulfovibrionaceae bacterium]|nr:30S ribosomal protein S12 methylthiotransferase RimO [Desulfovibrionaceae bacterium]
MLKVYPVSLGCPKTRVDTERLLGSLAPAVMVSEPDKADLIFVNTCSFIQPAVRESVQTILELAGDMEDMPAHRRPLLAVAGCLPARYGAGELAAELPEVDLWLDFNNFEQWAEKIKLSLLEQKGERFSHLSTAPGRIAPHPPSYAYLKISEGCRHSCAFCTIPSIRGPLRSYEQEALVQEAEWLLQKGVRELILVAQDLTAYGLDKNDRQAFARLLENIAPLPGLARLRLMYLYPSGITRELLQFIKDIDAPVLPYFDVPVQHSHPEILGAMGRPFAGNAAKTIDLIREVFPDAALRTSLIVGYPGETDAHFAHLFDFVEEMRFHNLGVFAYQAEEGTPAASFPNQVDEAVKEERRSEIMQRQAQISEEFLAVHLGENLPVLLDSPQGEWPGLWIGRTWFQAPEVDGITYVSGENLRAGELVTAEIVETGAYDLQALV